MMCGRFAPSPSGRMHLGNVLCALLAWCSARKQGGQFLLRIEDLDPERCPRDYAELIRKDLAWLGLDWDETAAHGSYYQSERSEIYERYFGILQEQGRIYPCFCSRAALHAASAPHLSDGRVIYDGRCRSLTAEEIKKKTRAAAMRVHVPDRTVSFTDGICGKQREHLPTDCGDFIVRRSDGVFAYQLAVTVDDGLMGVSEVVRGDDLLGSTARQIWLNEVFGFTPPAYYHIPLLLDEQGERLSKRDAALDLGVLRGRYRPEEIVGALAFASGLQERERPLSAQRLCADFTWDRLPRGSFRLPVGFAK